MEWVWARHHNGKKSMCTAKVKRVTSEHRPTLLCVFVCVAVPAGPHVATVNRMGGAAALQCRLITLPCTDRLAFKPLADPAPGIGYISQLQLQIQGKCRDGGGKALPPKPQRQGACRRPGQRTPSPRLMAKQGLRKARKLTTLTRCSRFRRV